MHQGIKSIPVKSHQTVHSTSTGTGRLPSLRLSSETLPKQQKEPETTDDESNGVASRQSKPRLRNSASVASPFKQDVDPWQESLPREESSQDAERVKESLPTETISDRTIAAIRSIPRVNPIPEKSFNQPVLSLETRKSLEDFRSSLGNEFFHFLALGDESVDRFLTDTKQLAPVIDSIFTDNAYYEEIEKHHQEIARLSDQLHRLRQSDEIQSLLQFREDLVNASSSFSVSIETIPRHQYQQTVEITKRRIGRILGNEKLLSDYHNKLREQVLKLSERVHFLTEKTAEYSQQCTVQYQYHLESYQTALQFKEQIYALEQLQMVRERHLLC